MCSALHRYTDTQTHRKLPRYQSCFFFANRIFRFVYDYYCYCYRLLRVCVCRCPNPVIFLFILFGNFRCASHMIIQMNNDLPKTKNPSGKKKKKKDKEKRYVFRQNKSGIELNSDCSNLFLPSTNQNAKS